MVGKETETGISGAAVARNIAELRGGVSFTEISRRLEDRSGWSVNAVGIKRIESCDRRVTVDDLVALAVALEVTPMTLLMPPSSSADDVVSATGTGDVHARQLLMWLRGDAPLPSQRQSATMRRALPEWWIEEQKDQVAGDIEWQAQLQFEIGALRDQVSLLEKTIATQAKAIAAQEVELEVTRRALSAAEKLIEKSLVTDGDN